MSQGFASPRYWGYNLQQRPESDGRKYSKSPKNGTSTKPWCWFIHVNVLLAIQGRTERAKKRDKQSFPALHDSVRPRIWRTTRPVYQQNHHLQQPQKGRRLCFQDGIDDVFPQILFDVTMCSYILRVSNLTIILSLFRGFYIWGFPES